MHKVSLSPEFLEAVRARRDGRSALIDRIEPSRSALLVIDMQNVFVAPGSALEVPCARGIVENINALSTAARDTGLMVIWVRTTFSDHGRQSWPLYFSVFAPGADGVALRSEFHEGSTGHAWWPALARHADDTIIDKDRFSPFAPGASSLDALLQERRRDTLIVTGTETNICCESTVRDAMMRDYRCILVSDATAAATDEAHIAALQNVALVFGDVVSTQEVLECIDAAAA